jgi:hypothetical protein
VRGSLREVPEQLVEIIEVVVETREDVERVKARQPADGGDACPRKR